MTHSDHFPTAMQEDAIVIEQEPMAHLTYRLRLEAPRMARKARCGQFLMLQVRDGLDPLLRRPLSFHRILPEEGAVELLYRVVGRGTWLLSRVAPAMRLGLLGPLGNGFALPQDPACPVAVVAGGIGIAPLMELLVHLDARRCAEGLTDQAIHLFYGARTAAELLPDDVFSGLGIDIHRSTDDGTAGFSGRVTQLLHDTVKALALPVQEVFACGPLAMQYHVARWATAQGIPSQLSLESLMACGLGACLGCALPAPSSRDPGADHYVHVCKDGPIFKGDAILWHKIQQSHMPRPTFLYS